MNIEKVREYCLSKPYATEDMPFGDDYVTFRIAGKIFCGIALSLGQVVQMKCSPDEFDEVTAQYPFVHQAWHWHKRHWIQVDLSDPIPTEVVCKLIDRAYEVVFSKLPKRIQKEYFKKENKNRAIIFDLDGTLLDTLQDLQMAVNFALRCHGMPERTIDEVRQFVGNGVRRLMELAVPEGERNPEFEVTFADFKAYYAEHNLDFTKPYSGIIDALKSLKSQGVRMAIVSNKLEEATEALRQHFFADYIETGVGDSPERDRKPAPDGVYEAIRRLGVSKDECVYVGDSDVDYRTAVNAGLPCISVLWGFRSREFLESLGATVFCEKPEDLMNLII